MSMNLFIGPYAGFLTPLNYPDCPEDLKEEWDRLLDDHERLEWNFSRGSPPTVSVRGQSMWEWCAAPIAERDNPPRWPMLLNLECWTGGFVGFDLLQSASQTDPGPFALHLSTDGTPTLKKADPQVERDWFASAYAQELHHLGRIFNQAPLLRWGFVAWLSG
jgi:hypothetical protein